MKNEPWIDSGEIFHNILDARIAAHDYAHYGWYTRVKKIPATRMQKQHWELYVKWGRTRFPACCRTKPMWRVPGSHGEIFWKNNEVEKVSKSLRKRARETPRTATV